MMIFDDEVDTGPESESDGDADGDNMDVDDLEAQDTLEYISTNSMVRTKPRRKPRMQLRDPTETTSPREIPLQ